MTDLAPDHPAVEAAARVALKSGWTCDTHEPEEWGVCPDCTESHLRTAHRALTAALPHLTADEPEALTPASRAAIAVAELADRLDAEAAGDFDGVSGTSVSLVKYETAKSIRAALEGETHA